MSTAEGLHRTYSVPVPRFLGCNRVTIELSVPKLPEVGAPIAFGEHVQREGKPTDTVIACTRGGILVSEDLGESWEWIAIPQLSDVAFRNSFTTAGGMHLLQGNGSDEAEGSGCAHGMAPVALLDQSWQFVECSDPAESPWHGSRSIDEANGVIVFAEYPANSGIYAPDLNRDDPAPEQLAHLRDSRLLRSTDGGRTWDVVLQLSWQTARHFHTVVADPWQPGRWWASTGDRPKDNRVWGSIDHGLTWTEIAVELPTDELHPALKPFAHNVLRYTDIVIRESDLLWGTDDLLGKRWLYDRDVTVARRAGSRLFQSPKDHPWKPTTVGYVGNQIRSMVDVGSAYLVATEASGLLGFCPQVLMLWKTDPFHLTPLFTVDNFRSGQAGTGFTYSRASRAAKDSVFFTYRSATDLFPGGACILRWRVLFD